MWLADPTRKKGVCTKLSPRWKGPFLVIKKLDDLTYLVKKSEKQRAAVFHLDRLEPYQGRNIPTWFSKVIQFLCVCVSAMETLRNPFNTGVINLIMVERDV